LFHDPGNTVLAARDTIFPKFSVNARGTVDFPALSMDDLDMVSQFSVIPASRALRAFYPSIITASGDLEHPAHEAYIRSLPMIRHKSIFHF